MNSEKNRTIEINLFDIPIAALTMLQTAEKICDSIRSKTELQHVVVNAGKIVAMQHDLELRDSVLNADIINADGQAVVWAASILGQPLPERVAGIDLMLTLIDMAHANGFKCYFLGAKREVVKIVATIFSEKFSPEVIAGYRDGYFKEEEEEQIAKEISSSGADILFVAMSSPKKEIFVNKYKKLMNVPFVMGVGGSFDVVAGVTKRAPLWMQKVGMEWFYRFIQEPRRMWKRYLVGNSKFMWLVLKARFK